MHTHALVTTTDTYSHIFIYHNDNKNFVKSNLNKSSIKYYSKTNLKQRMLAIF